MATLSSSSLLFLSPLTNPFTSPSSSMFSLSNLSPSLSSRRRFKLKLSASPPDVCALKEPPIIDKSAIVVDEAVSDDEFWAAACLRIRTFNEFKQESSGIEDHKRYLAEREFKALKKRVAGEREGFRTVSCINASIPLSHLSSISDDLCTTCKFSGDGEDRVVVGTLDLIQCMRLPDEIAGIKPEGIGADFLRAYLSNVCVAEELRGNGLGYAIISKAKSIAEEWGITHLYVHVAVDNEPAKNLYVKSGFIHERDEPEWQARYLNRPQRILFWFGLPDPYNL